MQSNHMYIWVYLQGGSEIIVPPDKKQFLCNQRSLSFQNFTSYEGEIY